MGPGSISSLGPSSSCPYSARCVELEFSEVRIAPVQYPSGALLPSGGPGPLQRSRLKKMVGYPFCATRLRSGCRERCPPLATATAATTTHSAAAHTRSKVKRGTPAIYRQRTEDPDAG